MERSRSIRRGRSSASSRSCTSQLKDFARKLTAFIFGHVGICGLVVAYIIVGAFVFMYIEAQEQKDFHNEILTLREKTVQRLWRVTYELNVLYQDNWTQAVADEVKLFQERIVQAVIDGYDGKNYTSPSSPDGITNNQWSFSSAFLYCLTVITTIGYGNIAPRTVWGKIVTIIYAMVGMPLFLLYVSNVGDFLATAFRWGYVKLCKCGGRKRRRRYQQSHDHGAPYADASKAARNGRYVYETQETLELQTVDHLMDYTYGERGGGDEVDYQTATVPITISLIVMVSYICGGAVLFGQWEEWDFLDGSYFCFISLSTTGLGDLVPGDSFNSSSGADGIDLSLIFCSMYLIIGMALIAMCFNLMQEEVIAKVRKCGRILGCFRSEEE